VLNVDLPAEDVRYRFALYDNPHAMSAVAIPPEIALGYPRYDGLKEVL
jgi:hypothetical protein